MESKSSCNLRSNIRAHANVIGSFFTLAAIGLLLIVLQLLYEKHKLHSKENKQSEIDWRIGNELGVWLELGLIHSLFTALYWIGYLKRISMCLTVTIVYIAICLVLGSIRLIGAFRESDFTDVYLTLFALVVLSYVLTVTVKLRSVISTSPFGFVALESDNVTTKDSPDAKLTKQTNATQIA